ncbi:hypothetical protein PR202_gb04945 [Eleusine coracana subsp. coracana]|uniref:Disease resistance N-terminal domain-containing protein n=1 Tax=Eleusine coracana subsp. coracana TaxID=191504 RepID=A0AAV5E5V8_ELECO|nr:hypothetical protein PR202_gb04945 [Eleusine coracana subsp. coracana]
MEPLLSAIVSDLLGRALSTVIQRYSRAKAEETEQKLQRLQRLLLRIEATVEEAEGRYITNQTMLRQLEMLRQGVYGGHYMLDTFRRTCSSDMDVQKTERVGKLEKMLDGLETLMGDMQEFVLFLEGYPRICRQPYITYLILGKVMFGRLMEMETVTSFLLRPEFNPGVLPIVGAARSGKKTLVEHVCLDERVRTYFSSIVFFTRHDLGAGNMAALKGTGVIKHQDRTASSHGRSLAVIELVKDMDEETWERLYSSASSFMEHGSKIIITSRSEKIVAFGTVQALRLKYLTEEAYWYFFKALAFGSANPEDQPKLASIGMEIAVLLKGSFLGANIVGSLMRANLSVEFWSRVLKCLKDFTSKYLLMYGEDPTDLLRRDQPVCIWRMARTQHAITICKVYRMPAPQNCVPELPTAQDILTGRVTDQGDFCMVSWRSTIPPYNTYLARCVSHKIRYPIANKKRPRQERI